jgi:hypothetical protein
MPYCPFCRNHHRSRRGEHIIPKWMSREFPETTWEIEDFLTKYIRKSRKYIHLTTRIVCARCNTGWMSDLEKLSKPIIVPLMHGIPSTLTVRDQVIIAKWLCKTAMVYDLHSEKQAPRPRYFEDDEYSAFASTLAHVPSYMFFVGKYEGEPWDSRGPLSFYCRATGQLATSGRPRQSLCADPCYQTSRTSNLLC